MNPPTRFFEELASRVRKARKARNYSLQQAAEKAGVSRRFLVEVEAARTNPSIGKLAALAEAYGVPLRDLCDLPTTAAPSSRIALLGLRGAGKSTIGRLVADQLEVPFSELDDLITELAGMTVAEIFELHGPEGYRQLEREALEAWLKRHGSGVLAVPGGIVSSQDAFDRLKATCRTVWLQARPEDHWQRVVEQGDMRPIQSHPQAMEQLKTLLERRKALYAQSDFQVDTHGRAAAKCAQEVVVALNHKPV